MQPYKYINMNRSKLSINPKDLLLQGCSMGAPLVLQNVNLVLPSSIDGIFRWTRSWPHSTCHESSYC